MSSNSARTAIIVGAAAIATTAVFISVWKLVSQFGVEGTMRYLWEGSPYPPEIREAITKLEKAERSIEKESLLDWLEESLERARLDSVDDAALVVPQWIIAHAPRDLKNDLAKVNHDLDKLAASVDSVPSHGNPDLKLRKKQCSQEVVCMMERADVLIAYYQQENGAK